METEPAGEDHDEAVDMQGNGSEQRRKHAPVAGICRMVGNGTPCVEPQSDENGGDGDGEGGCRDDGFLETGLNWNWGSLVDDV